MAENVCIGGIILYSDVIKVWAEREVGIDKSKLPSLDNLLATSQKAAAHSIFKVEFIHNGLC